MHDFGWALNELKAGRKIHRRVWWIAWEGRYLWLAPAGEGWDECIADTHPLLESQREWTPTHAELLTEDWEGEDGLSGIELRDLLQSDRKPSSDAPEGEETVTP